MSLWIALSHGITRETKECLSLIICRLDYEINLHKSRKKKKYSFSRMAHLIALWSLVEGVFRSFTLVKVAILQDFKKTTNNHITSSSIQNLTEVKVQKHFQQSVLKVSKVKVLVMQDHSFLF